MKMLQSVDVETLLFHGCNQLGPLAISSGMNILPVSIRVEIKRFSSGAC
jgi:hypothetical protein